MLALITLSIAFAVLNIGAAGLNPLTLYVACALVNISACIECIKNSNKKHLSSPSVTAPLILLFVYLFGFLLTPLTFYNSTTKLELYNDASQALSKGEELGLWDAFNAQFTNSLSFWNSIAMLLIYLLIPASIYLCAIMNRRNKMRLTYVMIFFAVANISATTIDQFIYSFDGSIWDTIDIGAKTSLGAFVNENQYGAFIAFFLPLLTIQVLHNFKTKSHILMVFYALLLCYFIFGVLISNSRGAFILCSLAFLLTFIFMKKSKSPAAGAFKCALITITILLFAYFTPSDLQNEMNSTGLEFGAGRERLYKLAPTIIKDFPTGTGPNAYDSVCASYMIDPKMSNVIPHHSENIYLQVLIDNGWPFYLFLGLIIYFTGKKIYVNSKTHVLSKRLQLASLISLVLFLCHASYDYPLQIPLYCMTVAIFIGFLLTPGEHYSKSVHSPMLLSFSKVTFILPLCATITLTLIYHSYDGEYRLKPSFSYSSQASLEDLAKNLPRNPASWHNWYFLYKRSAEKLPKDQGSFPLYCLQQAAIHHPNSEKLWREQAFMRVNNLDFAGATRSYRRYFLLNSQDRRSKIKDEALLFFTEDEYDYLLHLEMPMQERTREYIRSI